MKAGHKSVRKAKMQNSSRLNKTVKSKSKKTDQDCKDKICDAIHELDKTTHTLKYMSSQLQQNKTIRNKKKKNLQKQNNKMHTYAEEFDIDEIRYLKSNSSTKSIEMSKNHKKCSPYMTYLPISCSINHRQTGIKTPIYLDSKEERLQQSNGGCSMHCHELMSKLLQLRSENEYLVSNNKKLEKELFLKDIQKKELRKKLDEANIMVTALKNEKNQQTFQTNLKASNRQTQSRYQKKVPLNDSSNQQNLYRSMQLKPQNQSAHLYRQANNFSAQSNSMASKENIPEKGKKILNLWDRKCEVSLNKSSNIENSPSYIEYLNDEPDLLASPEFRSINQSDQKIQQLQRYFDKLVQINRHESNKMKKKQIWKEMKNVANEIKHLRAN